MVSASYYVILPMSASKPPLLKLGDFTDVRPYIQGRPVNLASRHTQLYEKYQKKYDRE